MPKPPDEPRSGMRPEEKKRPILPGLGGLQANVDRSASVAGASYSLIGAIVLLGGLGYFADEWLETSPWLLISGLLFGIIVGFYELARVVWRRKS
jgi:F0F1-type ATP synthase assembly protein I